ncbi:polysaccharide biosynthesis tyrosine autokinase [Janibacter anophelis]|uniref:polysaccharide biosynthesis tyrosine autokinase n=1 Tax=Janibacter anophelis TaxID=319054 RepID=UPI0013B0655F|nr:polysaccharide biosynthesis tyrosine autokinase [Janibacter anophelis]
MTLEDLWKLTRRQFAVIGLCALLGLVLAFGWMLLQPKEYTATAGGYVTAGGGQSIGESYSSQTLAQQKAQAYVTLFTNRRVTQAVIEDLGLETTPQALAGRISATVPPDGVTIEVSAIGPSPEEARDVADAVVTAAAAEAKRIEESGPTRQVVGADGKTRTVKSQAQVLIEPNESAILPSSPSSPNPSRILPVGLLLGLLVGYGLAAVRHYNDTKVRHTEDVEAATGAGVLGILPKSEDLGSERGAVDRTKSFHERESLRKLRTNLRFVDVDHQPRSIVITSAKQGEGKSTVASNLATVLAEAGERVVLVDADLRRSAVARAFDLDGSVGLSQVLAGTATLGDALQPSHTDGLEILAAGAVPPNPSELLGSHRMEQLIEQLAQDYFVVLDAPPLLPVTDAALLTRSADGAVIVVAAGKTHKEEVERAAAALRAVDGKVLGAILNQVSTSKVDRIRYGDVEYGYTKSYTNDYVYKADGAGATSRQDVKAMRRKRG